MKNFVIAGAGGFGREVYSYLLNSVKAKTIRGFLDDNPNALNGYSFHHKIISGFNEYKPLANDVVIFAIANPKAKRAIVSLLKNKGAKFESFIHPSAIINLNVKIAEGVVIAPFCVINSNAKIGEFASINVGGKISNKVEIGAFCTVSSQCVIGENCSLKEESFMASSSVLSSNTTIFENSTLGINSYSDKDIEKSKCAFGNPAKYL